ncbi:MAG: DNA-binding protein WhiA [Ruminococcaceae bacterium]|nr:DNA-binding protein WhiA [Oscillospiraceae bacterium]
MSFCTDIKNELAGIRPPKRCKLPLVYGFLLFGRSFSYKRICMQTNNNVTAEYYARLLSEVYRVTGEITVGGGARPTYKVEVPSSADRLKILASLDFGMHEGAINREIITDARDEAAFIRGAFLASGNLSDPEKSYRADFSVKDEALALELLELLSNHYIEAKISKRGNGFVVYVGKSEMLTNLLTLLGVTERSLALIETTILKSVKNNMNRASNCDNANISKTVEASIIQRTAIEYLERTGRLETLDAPLYSAAVLRRDNPELSLSQLCRVSPEPITVSGLNHRLKKILEIYNELIK